MPGSVFGDEELNANVDAALRMVERLTSQMEPTVKAGAVLAARAASAFYEESSRTFSPEQAFELTKAYTFSLKMTS